MARERPANESEIRVTRLDRVESKPIPWLWQDWIPLGMVSALAGVPKVGKGVISASLASMVTRGTLPGDLLEEPAYVMVAWSEDPDASIMLKPRIEAAGGDPNLVGAVTPFKITEENIAQLQAKMEKRDVRLLVIDQLLDFLEPGLNFWSDEVRPPLNLLTVLANETAAAVLVVLHESDKGTSRKIMNATAFTAVPRVILSAEWRKKKRRLRMVSSNLGTKPNPLEYTTEISTDGKGGDEAMVKVVWLSDVEASVRPQATAETVTQGDLAEMFLRRSLRSGDKPVSTIMQKAADKGLSESTVKRAASRLKVRKSRVGFPAEGFWGLS